MSDRLCHARGMKIKKSVRFQASSFGLLQAVGRKFVTAFGAARLVKNKNGRHELIGGTADDHAAAQEWCSLFAHEVVFSACRRRQRTREYFAPTAGNVRFLSQT